MSIELVGSLGAGGSFFNPDENKDAVAILLEVKSFDAQVGGGQYGPRDRVTADVTIFDTAADIASGNAKIIKGVYINQTYLARDLKPVVGKAAVQKLDKTPTKGNPAWVWRDVDASVLQAVAAYLEKREAAVAAAVAAAPSFD